MQGVEYQIKDLLSLPCASMGRFQKFDAVHCHAQTLHLLMQPGKTVYERSMAQSQVLA
jgi:hypothetical protein